MQTELGLKVAKWDSVENNSSGYNSQSPLQISLKSVNNTDQFEQSSDDKNTIDHKSESLSSNNNDSKDFKLHLSNIEDSKIILEVNKNDLIPATKQNMESSFVSTKNEQNKNRKQSSSFISDEDCLSASPTLQCSKLINYTNSSRSLRHRKTKQHRISVAKALKRKKRNSLVKKANSTRKQYKIISDLEPSDETSNKVLNLHELASLSSTGKLHNTPNSNNERNENIKALHENINNHELASTHIEHTEHRSTDINIDYFNSSLNISESKLHEKTQHFKKETCVLKPNISYVGNTNDKTEKLLDRCDNKNAFTSPLRNSDGFSEGFSNVKTKENDENFDNIQDVFKNSIFSATFKECVNLSSSSLKDSENLEKNIVNLTENEDNKRLSSDFFSTPSSNEKPIPSLTKDNLSPNLFGDSFVVDSQLDEMLEGCYNDNEDACKNNIVSTKEMPSDSPQHFNSLACKKTAADYQYVQNISKMNKHITEIQSDLVESKKTKRNFLENKNVQIQSDLVESKNKKRNFLENKNIQSLRAVIITSRELQQKSERGYMKLKEDADLNFSGEVEDLSKEETKSLSSHDIQCEDINFQSVFHNNTLQTPVKILKKGLVSSVTYNLNEKMKSENSSSSRKRRKSSISGNFIERLNKNKKMKTYDNLYAYRDNGDIEESVEKQINIAEDDSKKLSAISISDKNKLISAHETDNIDSEDDNCITDSFLEKAFDTYWELKEDSGNKKQGQIMNAKIQNKSRTSALQQKNEISRNKNDNANKSNNEVSCIISNSFLENAFNSCWEDDMTFKSETLANGKKIRSFVNNSKCKILNNTSIKENQIAVTAETISISERKKDNEVNKLNRRRSPRLLEASKCKLHTAEVNKVCKCPKLFTGPAKSF